MYINNNINSYFNVDDAISLTDPLGLFPYDKSNSNNSCAKINNNSNASFSTDNKNHQGSQLTSNMHHQRPHPNTLSMSTTGSLLVNGHFSFAHTLPVRSSSFDTQSTMNTNRIQPIQTPTTNRSHENAIDTSSSSMAANRYEPNMTQSYTPASSSNKRQATDDFQSIPVKQEMPRVLHLTPSACKQYLNSSANTSNRQETPTRLNLTSQENTNPQSSTDTKPNQLNESLPQQLKRLERHLPFLRYLLVMNIPTRDQMKKIQNFNEACSSTRKVRTQRQLTGYENHIKLMLTRYNSHLIQFEESLQLENEFLTSKQESLSTSSCTSASRTSSRNSNRSSLDSNKENVIVLKEINNNNNNNNTTTNLLNQSVSQLCDFYKHKYEETSQKLLETRASKRQYQEQYMRKCEEMEITHRQINALKESLTCSICMDKRKDTVFDSCGHVCCHECSTRIQRCFVCSKPINKKFKYYDS